MTTEPITYSIKQTSEMTGLTSSVLRIWELRYGWPCPQRKFNGYRFYSQHQVDELTRMSSLVKEGMLISSLIEDGLPRWPAEGAPRRNTRVLSYTRSLTAPSDRAESTLHRTLVDALEQHRSMEVQQILQRIFWTVRPQDEAKTALIPTLVAISELNSLDRPIPDAGKIMEIVKDRCVQLLRMQRISSDALYIVPARGGDDAMAALVAVILCHRGIPSRPWTQPGVPTTAFITASDGEGATFSRKNQVGAITLRGGNGSQALHDLLDPMSAIAGVAETANR